MNTNKAVDLDTIFALLQDTPIIAREWVDSASEWIEGCNLHCGFSTPTQIAQLIFYMYTSGVTPAFVNTKERQMCHQEIQVIIWPKQIWPVRI